MTVGTAERFLRELQSNVARGGNVLTEAQRHEKIRKVAAVRDTLTSERQREGMTRKLHAATTSYERRVASSASSSSG